MTAGDETIFNQSAFWTRIASPSKTNILIYAGNQVVAELDESGNLRKTYTWGPGIDNLLAFTTGYGTSSTNTYYPLTDHLGTIQAIADKTGSIIESYRYDAWGRLLGVYDSDGRPRTSGLGLPTSAIGNAYLFQGRRYSWNTGFYNFRARWYDPVTGRWLSKDPIGISGGLNQYAAFGNNPVNARDPEGKDIYYYDGGGQHSRVIIDFSESSNGRILFEFAPKQGNKSDLDFNVLYGPSETLVEPYREKPHRGLRISTTSRQDNKAVYGALLAQKKKLPYCVLFNNCAHMARAIIRCADIPLGNKLFDTPSKLKTDINNYLNSQKNKKEKIDK